MGLLGILLGLALLMFFAFRGWTILLLAPKAAAISAAIAGEPLLAQRRRDSQPNEFVCQEIYASETASATAIRGSATRIMRSSALKAGLGTSSGTASRVSTEKMKARMISPPRDRGRPDPAVQPDLRGH